MKSQILILDDDIEFRDFLMTALVNVGHDVITVGRHDQALGLLRTMPFDLLLVDGHLPDGNGVDFIANVRQHDANVQIIFLSAFSGYFERDKTRELLMGALNVAEMLRKPIDEERILRSVSRALQRSASVSDIQSIGFVESFPQESISESSSFSSMSSGSSQPSLPPLDSTSSRTAYASYAHTPSRYALHTYTDEGAKTSISFPQQQVDLLSIEDRFSHAREAGLASTKERLTRLRELLIDNPHPTMSNFQEAHTIAHKVHGSAGSYGLSKVSQYTEKLELSLRELLNGASFHALVQDHFKRLLEWSFQSLQGFEVEASSAPKSNSPAQQKIQLLPKGLHGKLLFQAVGSGHTMHIRQICAAHNVEAFFVERIEDVKHAMQEHHFDALFLRLYSVEEESAIARKKDPKKEYTVPKSIEFAHTLRPLSSEQPFPLIPTVFFGEDPLLEDRILAAQTSDLFFTESDLGLELLRFLQVLFDRAKKKRRLLIVSPSEQLHGILQQELEPKLHAIRCTHDPAQLIHELKVFHPDLIIVEFDLSDVNGIDMCRVIRAIPEWQQTPIFMYSQESLKSLPKSALNAGVTDLLSGQDTPTQMAQKIQAQLHHF